MEVIILSKVCHVGSGPCTGTILLQWIAFVQNHVARVCNIESNYWKVIIIWICAIKYFTMGITIYAATSYASSWGRSLLLGC